MTRSRQLRSSLGCRACRVNHMMRRIAAGVLCSASLMLAACGGDSISGGTGSTPITVGGTVTGLATGAVAVRSNHCEQTLPFLGVFAEDVTVKRTIAPLLSAEQ